MCVPLPGTVVACAMSIVAGRREEFSCVAAADFWLRLTVRFLVVSSGAS